MLYALHITNSI